ncbi:hypothetical protein [Glaciimonas sp. PCH181]|uniref:hypothetical protein n=1 Tax=Glaciimonas sp. PCH181 TaxID=2133943 RepID=UPI000D335868|nr:hypothetical protein [Glaciimonas sp. PCH181]PUA19623.1 hypothetical protein C7W93_07195 [Glaciimonas sp. PCH181]
MELNIDKELAEFEAAYIAGYKIDGVMVFIGEMSIAFNGWMLAKHAALSQPQADPGKELASMTRMFHAACESLGVISDELGCDPIEGGAEPILDAIKELKALSQPQGEPVAWHVLWADIGDGIAESLFYGHDAKKHMQSAVDHAKSIPRSNFVTPFFTTPPAPAQPSVPNFTKWLCKNVNGAGELPRFSPEDYFKAGHTEAVGPAPAPSSALETGLEELIRNDCYIRAVYKHAMHGGRSRDAMLLEMVLTQTGAKDALQKHCVKLASITPMPQYFLLPTEPAQPVLALDWFQVNLSAQSANAEYGQWMPERWVQLFVTAYNKGK